MKASTAVQWVLLLPADAAWMEYPSRKICSARETGTEFVPQPQAGGLAGILKPVFIDTGTALLWFLNEQGLAIARAGAAAAWSEVGGLGGWWQLLAPLGQHQT